MGDPTTYLFDLSDAERPAPVPLEEQVYSKIQWFNAHRASKRLYNPVTGIEGIVIHATAGGSTSGALSWWERPDGAKASAHWIVPDEDEAAHGKSVLAVVYEALAAWHVRNTKTHPLLGNRTRINHWTLGIEVVNRQTGHDPFSDWQIEATAAITRYCWAKYPNFRYVFSHALVDPGRRNDPGPDFDWARFETLVRGDSSNSAAITSPSALDRAVDDALKSGIGSAGLYCRP
jgi:N-acetylmuramoyl-L-alanine amidase